MLRFYIANMNCGGCAKGVAAALHEGAVLSPPRFNLERREVTLDVPENEAERLAAVLIKEGWEAKLLTL